MTRGGYHPEAYPWRQVRPDRRAEKAQGLIDARDSGALWALLRHHMQLRGRVSPQTLSAYRSGLSVFLRWAATQPTTRLVMPDADFGAEYLRHLEAQRLSPATVNTRRAVVKAFYRALRWTGVTAADPMSDVPPVRDPTPRSEKREAYRDGELRALLAQANPAERAALLLGVLAGLRLSEALALRWTDVDLHGGMLTVAAGKGGKRARVVLAPALADALRALQQQPPAGRAARAGYVLPWGHAETVRGHLRRLCEETGVRYEGRHFHGLRHAAGTIVYRRTRNLDAVARHLRHSNLETSRIYAEWDSDEVRDALAGWEA